MAIFDFFRKKPSMPAEIRELVEFSVSRTSFTPDLWKLRMYSAQFVFINDELQTGLNGHAIIEGLAASPVYRGFTVKPVTVYKKDLGFETFPVTFEEKHVNVPFLRTRGELYLFPSANIINLDNYRQNGTMFLRKLVKILIPYTHMVKLPRASQFTEGTPRFEYPVVAEVPRNLGDKYLTEEKFSIVHAWMYFANPEYWDAQIFREGINAAYNGYTPGSVFELNKPFRDGKAESNKYYNFTRLDYGPK